MSDNDYEPFLVPPGWVRSVFVRGLWDSYRVLFYADGTARFEHRCDRGERAGTVICAPLLSDAHTITSDDPLTIAPSISCPDCGTHGQIRNGQWHPA